MKRFFATSLVVLAVLSCCAIAAAENGNLWTDIEKGANGGRQMDAQKFLAAKEWVDAAREVAEKTDKHGIFHYLVDKTLLCTISGRMIACPERGAFEDKSCLVPISSQDIGDVPETRGGNVLADFEVEIPVKNGEEGARTSLLVTKGSVAFFQPFQKVIIIKEFVSTSRYWKGVSLLRSAYEMMNFEFSFFKLQNWEDIDNYAWSRIQVNYFIWEVMKKSGGQAFEKMVARDAEALKKWVCSNGNTGRYKSLPADINDQLDQLFSKALSEEERVERLETYFQILNLKLHGYNYGEQFYFLRECFLQN